MELVRPALAHLPSFRDAVARGWPLAHTPADCERAQRQLDADPESFLAALHDPEAKGPPITIPTGAVLPRLPEIAMWMWADGFVGQVNLRWQKGTTDLPPSCLGHIGYTVAPWARRKGYATEGLRQALPVARVTGLPWVELVTDRDNRISQRVIRANGGILVEEFEKLDVNGGGPPSGSGSTWLSRPRTSRVRVPSSRRCPGRCH